MERDKVLNKYQVKFQMELLRIYIQKCCLKYGDLVKISYSAPDKETGSTVEPGTSNAFETMI